MAKSDYLEIAVLDWLRGTAFPTAPTTVYLGLSTGDPGDDAAGLAEPAGAAAYVRQPVTFDPVIQVADRGRIVNSGAITFPTATANWGTITHAALFDALTGGTMLYQGALAAPRPVGLGDAITFAIGDIIVEES